jgi:hypothetical protein
MSDILAKSVRAKLPVGVGLAIRVMMEWLDSLDRSD